MNRVVLAILMLGSLCWGAAWAQELPSSERRAMTALRIPDAETIVVDGDLKEPAWARATAATDFIQQLPQNGAPATERTEVRIIYNHTTLYMGVICYDDEPGKLLRFQMRRDQGLPSDDRFMWVIDPFRTAQYAYHFETNPSGLMGDGLIGPNGYNRDWDGIWTARVRRSDIGWTIEIAIPFTTLNFDPSSTEWGINFQRSVRRKNEESLWSGWALNQGLFRLSAAGVVSGLNQDVTQGIGLDVRPYALATADASPITGQPATHANGKAGLDLLYSPTPGLRANFTLNTDFAQTEVDQRAVNLTQFALFYPEKRTFFLEGANYFDFATNATTSIGSSFSRPTDNSLIPFFSRQIGLDQNANPQRVNYGAKMIGQVAKGLDVGVLQVQTGDDNELHVAGENFTVGRIKQRFLRQSYIGALYTSRSTRGAGGTQAQTAGVDFQLATSTFRGHQNLSLAGFALDAAKPATSGGHASYGIQVDYPNDRWNTGAAFRTLENNFRPALGFLTRPSGYRRYQSYLNFSPRPKSSHLVRRMGFTADADLQTDTSNIWLTRLWTLTPFNLDLQTEDTVSFLVLPEYERLNRDFLVNLRDRVLLPNGSQYQFTRYRLTGSTANRRHIAVSPTIEWGGFYSGTRREVALNLTLRARPGLIVYLGTDWNRIDLPQTHFATRLFQLTPELQFGQWISLVNTVQYDSVSSILGWQSRFRWILQPGDDLYVVYTENWIDQSGSQLAMLNRRAATKLLYTKRF